MYLTLKQHGKQIHFIYTPFHEMISALHTLSNPTHHKTRLLWAQEKLAAMSEEMKAALSRFADMTDGFMTVYEFEKRLDHWELSLSEMIDGIERLSDAGFYDQLANNGQGNFERQRFDDPELKGAFIVFLRDFYMDHFTNDLAYSEPIMIRHIKKEFARASEMDVYDYIQGLHPRIDITEDRILFHKYRLFDVKKEDVTHMLIHADSYVIPHLLMGIDEEKEEVHFVTPVYLTAHNQDFKPTELLGIFKGLGDGTRLSIIRHLYKQPQTTQRLSDLLDISEPGVSKQLKLLHKAGIVFKERDGQYIRYHLNQQIIDSLVLYMYEYLT